MRHSWTSSLASLAWLACCSCITQESTQPQTETYKINDHSLHWSTEGTEVPHKGIVLYEAETFQKEPTDLEKCTMACVVESKKRNYLWNSLMRGRETVRRICQTRGTSHQKELDAMTVEPESKYAHDRIEENEGTGKLEYREKDQHVVIVRPEWICPPNTSEELRLIAKRWMYDIPREWEPKQCDLLKVSIYYRGIDLDTCLKWTKTPGAT